MMKSTPQQQRATALNMLHAVRQWPHIDKERLFTDCMDFSAWLNAETSGPADLDVYAQEFAMHHGKLFATQHTSLKEAAFITWFVANRLHKLPLLRQSGALDANDAELMRRIRFTHPCFTLPTEDREDTYMIQWLYWHFSHLDDERKRAEPLPDDVDTWTDGLLLHLPGGHPLPFERLSEMYPHCRTFFSWCWTRLRDFSLLHSAAYDFVLDRPDISRDTVPLDIWDAHFIVWLVEFWLPDLENWRAPDAC